MPLSRHIVLAVGLGLCLLAALGRPTATVGQSAPASLAAAGDENWDARFAALGLNGPVTAIAVSGGDVYVGGGFTQAGGVAANHVARWDGTTWHALGSGVDDWALALAVQGSDVYVGGLFTQAGGVSAAAVARWDGAAWHPLGGGVDDWVRALAVSGSNVYVGGSFTTAVDPGGGSVTTRYLARWDGSAWRALGGGLNDTVRALAVAANGDLLVGGDFTIADVGGAPPVSAPAIARWRGGQWSALAGGLSGCSGLACATRVEALAVRGGDVFAGGTFTTAHNPGGPLTVNHIARWDGAAWSPLAGGVGGPTCDACAYTVAALAVTDTRLYAGGAFTMADIWTAPRVAQWDGATWAALGSGVNDRVNALGVQGADLSVGGDFTIAGGKSSGHVAQWHAPAPPPPSTGTPTATPTRTLTPTPTPTNPAARHVRGQVRLQGRASAASARVTLDGAPLALGTDGRFDVAVAPGQHTVAADAPLYLSSATTVTVAAADVTLPTVTLLGGDAKEDDAIALLDLVIVAANYGSAPPSDPRADIDGSRSVDLPDLIMVAGNYGLTGPTEWTAAAAKRRAEKPATPPRLWLDGPDAVAAGETFTVTVRAADAADVAGADVALAFDPRQVSILSVEDEQSMMMGGPGLVFDPAGRFVARHRVDAERGVVEYVVARLGRGPGPAAGVVLAVRCQAQAAGRPAVSLAHARLVDGDGQWTLLR